MAEIARRRTLVFVALGLLLVVALVTLIVILWNDPEEVAPIAAPSFSLVVVGDFGTGGGDEMAVAKTLRTWSTREDADALLTTGDNVYPEGDPAYFHRTWDVPYGWTESSGIEVLASIGNHDFEYQGGSAVRDHLGMPGFWYGRSVGNADVFVLDSNRVDVELQTAWLEKALRDSSATWKIVVFHHPAFSCSQHGSTSSVIDSWVPLFDREEVDLVLNGHDHNYQRFQEEGDPTYVVTGGGGAGFYGLEDCDFDSPVRVEGDDQKHHFLFVEGGATRLRVRAITQEGEALDDFELSPAAN